MNNLSYKHLLTCLFTVTLLFTAVSIQAQDQENVSEQDTTSLVEEENIDDSESASIWELIGQAGSIRYPIYGILIAGIFLISMRSYEFYMDRKMSEELEETSFRHMSLNEISSKISSQPDFMLSRIMAKLLNVFETNRNADYLHDEIANYNSVQQDNFNTFKNRIDFLSDTAGALGLLGTVWGMFTVFYSGTLEKEVILAGMGIALMSTLLGLVVSIILNFCSTLTEGFFSKHLEKITSKADELRFRLIELSENSSVSEKRSVSTNNNYPPKNTGIKKAEGEEATSHESGTEKEEKKPEKENKPAKISFKTKIDKVKVNQEIKDVKVELYGTLGEPVNSSEIEIILEGNGSVNGKNGKDIVKTNSDGIASFDWKIDEKIGEKKALIRCVDKEYNDVKSIIKVDAIADEPESLKLLNNHQAGHIGKQLNKPVSVIVSDKFGNPVTGIKVLMKVTMGNGKFENGKRETIASTDKDGKVYIDFTLGSEAGFNAIDISLPKYDITKSFQAVGQEVTV